MAHISLQDHPSSRITWPPLIPGVLIKRYKRFLADVELANGKVVTAHCTDSGSMQECSEPGRTVYVSFHDNPRRKLKYSWQLIQMQTSLVGVNTLIPNRLVALAAAHGQLPKLIGYDNVTTEVRINQHTRLDIKLDQPDGPACFIEVKNCTLVRNGHAAFPDAPTLRGQKHLTELMQLKSDGHRAVIFFVIQRSDAQTFGPADIIDPDYGRLLRQAVQKGVELMVYDVALDLTGILLNREISYLL